MEKNNLTTVSNAIVTIELECNKIIEENIKLSYGDAQSHDYMSMASKYIKDYISKKYSSKTKYKIIKFF